MKQGVEKKSKNTQNGITLIALIITIIVLLILAGVTISAITSNESVMEKAKMAREQNDISTEEDMVKLAVVNAIAEELTGTISNDDNSNSKKKLLELLTPITLDANVALIGKNAPWVVTGKVADNKKYIISANGEIAEKEKPGLYGLDGTYIKWEDLDKTETNGKIEQINNKSYTGKLVLPSNITHIGPEAFYNCSGLTEIVMPEGLNLIESSAFERCGGLKSITIPNSVTSIGRKAFKSDTSLMSVKLPDNIVKIGYECFSGCKSLKSIVIPENVKFIEQSAFFGSGLMNITFNDKLEEIYQSAFGQCRSLTSIVIPKNVIQIDRFSF